MRGASSKGKPTTGFRRKRAHFKGSRRIGGFVETREFWICEYLKNVTLRFVSAHLTVYKLRSRLRIFADGVFARGIVEDVVQRDSRRH